MKVENPDAYGTGLSALSPAQYEAATHVHGPCRVVAGPGSGKTLVITYRLLFLINTSKIDPSSILTITFTKAAAAEMQKRALNLLGDKGRSLQTGTFHSVFYKILSHSYRFSKENIIDHLSQSEIIKEICGALHIELMDKSRTIAGLINEISRCKSRLDKEGVFESAYVGRERFEELFIRYKKRMNDLRLIDFDDMMLLSLDLFRERAETLKKWQEKFLYLQVDEFQDVDPVQYELIKLLSGESRNLFLVGDDDQSIYGFRGSDPGIMLNTDKDYPDIKKICLSVNYRSDPEIVKAAGKVIVCNSIRIEKEIVSGKDIPGHGERPDIRVFKDRTEEICAFAELIKNREKQSAAILLRTNELINFFAEKLAGMNIRFKCREKIKNIYESREALDILSYLAVAKGEGKREDFFRIMNHPYRGISRNALPSENIDFASLYRFHEPDISTVAKIRRLENDLKILSKMKPYAAVHYILNGMGYIGYLKNIAQQRNTDQEELINTALEIKERAKGFRSYERWREAIEEYSAGIIRLNQENAAAGKDSDEEDILSLMTIHASKGLEFDEVFIFDVNEGIVPYHKAVLPSEIEEERRLLYVAMTRARRSLHLWSVRENMGKSMEVSRFLNCLSE